MATATATTASASMASTAATSTSTEDEDLPPLYHFPPFFTRQPNAETLSAQTLQWCQLILDHFKARRRFVCVASADECSRPPFRNAKLDRALKPAHLREILEALVAQGAAEWADGRAKERCLIYWRKPDEWADTLYRHIDATGAQGSVLTVYELVSGDRRGAGADELKDLDPALMKRAVDILQKRGKAQMMRDSNGDDLGIKFF